MEKKIVDVVPCLGCTFNELFVKEHMFYAENEGLNPHYKYMQNLVLRDYTLQDYNNNEHGDILYLINNICIKQLWKNRKSKIIYLASEPEVAYPMNSGKNLVSLSKHFDSIITWNDSVAGLQGILKGKYYFDLVPFSHNEIIFEKKKLMTSISTYKKTSYLGELYSEREKVIDYFGSNHIDDFEFWGSGWAHKGYINYRGRCESKLQTYSNYKFALAFENCNNAPGYVTEKIFDCFKTLVVPIYAGAPNVSSYIPKGCYIDYYQFENVEELYQYMKSMPRETYEEYIRNIKDFLTTEEAKSYSLDSFSDVLYSALEIPKRLKVITLMDIITLSWMKVKARLKKEFYIRRNIREIASSVRYRLRYPEKFGH